MESGEVGSVSGWCENRRGSVRSQAKFGGSGDVPLFGNKTKLILQVYDYWADSIECQNTHLGSVGGVSVERDGLPVDGGVPDLEAHWREESCQDALPGQDDPLHIVTGRVNVLG